MLLLQKLKKMIINTNLFKKCMLYRSLRVNSFMPIKKGTTYKKREKEVIISLTSYPLRISTVHLTICSLLHQTCKPDRIILWLATSEFLGKENDLPVELLLLKKYGLEIYWCENIKSFKKLIPAMRTFSNAIIVTADDDQYYPRNWLKGLYKAHKNNPEVIIDYDVTRLKLIGEQKIVQDIELDIKNGNLSYFNKILGGYGCLYPPKSLDQEVFNETIFMKHVGLNDDVWFWGMAVKNRKKIMRITNKQYQYCMTDAENQNQNSLWSENSVDNLWLTQLNDMLKIYPEIIEILKMEKQCK